MAGAAPLMPMFSVKMNRGSSAMFSAAPMITVIMPTLGKPWALMKGFMPRLIRTGTVPTTYTRK